ANHRTAIAAHHHPRLGRGAAALLPDLLDGADELQERGRGHRGAAAPSLHPDARELRRGAGAGRLPAFRTEQRDRLGRRHGAGAGARHPGRLCDGLPSDAAHPLHSAVDAVHQDAALGRRAGADLPAVPHLRPARQPRRPRRHLCADEPADRRLDALHLLQGGAGRDPGGGPDGRGADRRRILAPAAAADGAGHRLDRAALAHPLLERGLLEPQPHLLGGGAADGLHRLLLLAAGVVLRQALRRLDGRGRAHSRLRLAQPAPARARADLRRREV
ncbi:MAG: Various polyols ABC transporter, permease protein 2, partial [uncultured Craurococcus sp.]